MPAMNFKRIYNATRRPGLYEKGSAVMWTDDYISGRLLEMHLDPEVDSASRRPENIRLTMEFLGGFMREGQMEVLDLGCGPGLYTERLAELGHRVSGIDFSGRSIAFAKEQALKKGLDIDYRCMDYLQMDYEERFDLVILIYNDFSVLLPEERRLLLEKVFRALKKGGVFVFDVLNDRDAEDKFLDDSSWTVSEKDGFWKDTPYLELVSMFHYPGQQVYLKQHLIIDQNEDMESYRFWIHYYSARQAILLLSERGFGPCTSYEDVLPETDIWDGGNLNFYAATKPV
jgi:SAM-dependent methyltransferase